MLFDKHRHWHFLYLGIMNNLTISKFMGFELYSIPREGETDFGPVRMVKVIRRNGVGFWSLNRNAASLEFHSNWNWLMDVVEEIEGKKNSKGDGYRFNIDMCNVSIENTDIKIMNLPSKIQTVYEGCIQFINWYNKQEDETAN